jgi:hypothetical protein
LRFAAAGILTLLVATVAACVRPSAVVRYAESASRTTEEFPQLAREIHASCLRVEAYKAQRKSEWYDEVTFRRACATRDTAVFGLIQANDVIAAYLKALASIAGNSGASLEPQTGRFVKLLAGKAGFNEPQADAAERLAEFVASKSVEGFKRRELSRVIAAHNADVQTVVSTLLRIVTQDFPSAFNVESTAQDNFYRTSLAEFGEREPLAAILVREQRDRRAMELMNKRRAITSYAAALRRIQSGHQKLYDERNHLDAPALAVELIRAAKELDSITRELDRAFR